MCIVNAHMPSISSTIVSSAIDSSASSCGLETLVKTPSFLSEGLPKDIPNGLSNSIDAPFTQIVDRSFTEHVEKIAVVTEAMHKMLKPENLARMRAGWYVIKAIPEIYATYEYKKYKNVVIKSTFVTAKIYVPPTAAGMCGSISALTGHPWLSYSAGILCGTGASIATEHAEDFMIRLIGN